MRRWPGIWAGVVLSAALSGCAGLSPQDSVDDAALTAAGDVAFAVRGRFSAQYENEAFAAGFRWQHAPATDVIDFFSPMGAIVAQLSRHDQALTLRQGDAQPVQEASDWETLTRRTFGFSLPVAGLAYWIRGVPQPDATAHATRDTAGRIDNLRQHGWTIQYTYAAPRNVLPERLDVRYGETIGLRLKIDGFQAAQTE